MKEDNWKLFIGELSNLDPWGPVYRVCGGRNVRQGSSTLCVNDECVITWRECANCTLLERFIPVASISGDESPNVSVTVQLEHRLEKFEWEEISATGSKCVRKVRLCKALGWDYG